MDQSTSSVGQGKAVYAWYSFFFFAWISAAVTNVSACCNESTKERKKNRSVSGLYHLFTRDSATGAAIALRKILITILSVSKRNCAQPPPSHIKPITFGNELQTNDMIPYTLPNLVTSQLWLTSPWQSRRICTSNRDKAIAIPCHAHHLKILYFIITFLYRWSVWVQTLTW